MLEDSTMNVLKPFANDFLLSPTIIEVDKIPNETRPNITKSPRTVNTMPVPIQIKINAKAIVAKNNSPGEKSLVSS